MSTTTNQQFEGSTIEEALEAAVATLGDDLQIVDAQRVRRRGVLGVGRRERFEVTASRKAEQADAFDSVLKRMVDRVDQAEQRLGVDLADTDTSWWREADFVLPKPKKTDIAADATPVIDMRTNAGTVPFAQASAVPTGPRPEIGHAPAHAAPPKASPYIAPVLPDIEELSAVQWSAERLVAIGLPSALVGRLPDGLISDLEWVAALAKAIDELLETSRTMSGPCELTGHGQHAVVHLIRGACDGFRIGALVIDGERVPATPMELALAVRAVLRDLR